LSHFEKLAAHMEKLEVLIVVPWTFYFYAKSTKYIEADHPVFEWDVAGCGLHKSTQHHAQMQRPQSDQDPDGAYVNGIS